MTRGAMLAFVIVLPAVVILLLSTKFLEPRQFNLLEVYMTRALLHSIYALIFSSFSMLSGETLNSSMGWKMTRGRG